MVTAMRKERDMSTPNTMEPADRVARKAKAIGMTLPKF